MNRTKAVKSLASLDWGRRAFYFVPLRSVAYAAASLVVVFLVLLFIDRVVLGSLEWAGWTSGERWDDATESSRKIIGG